MTVRALTLSVRALRESTRSRGPVVLRGLLLACLFFAVYLAQVQAELQFGDGKMLLFWIAWTDYVLLTLLVVSAFSSVITEEKELMSLGLLRLAGFTPASILLGKSVGLLVNAMLLLIVQLPLCMLAITLGGVHLAQVLEIFGLLLAYLMFGYGLAMLSSVVSPRNSAASRLTTILLLVYHFLPPLVIALLYRCGLLSSSEPPPSWLMSIISTSAVFTLAQSTSMVFGFGTAAMTTPILVNLGAGLGLLLLSWLVFDRYNRNEVPSAPIRLNFAFLRKRDSRPSRRCWSDAVAWKDYEFISGGRKQMLLRSATYLGVIGLFVFVISTSGARRLPEPRHIGAMMMGMMCFVIVLEAGLITSRMFQQEVKGRTLGSLLGLPMGLGTLVWAKVRGCAFVLLPALAFFAIGALLAPDDFGEAVGEILSEPVGWYCLSLIPLGLCLTAYLSLRVSRGAFGLSLAVLGVGVLIYWSGAMLLSMGKFDEEVPAFFGVVVSIFGTIALARATGARLRRLAADD